MGGKAVMVEWKSRNVRRIRHGNYRESRGCGCASAPRWQLCDAGQIERLPPGGVSGWSLQKRAERNLAQATGRAGHLERDIQAQRVRRLLRLKRTVEVLAYNASADLQLRRLV